MSTNNPWLALSTYEEKDEKSFYGREQDANNLFSMLQQNETVICYAASGDGKSSLINAGLCPKLRRDDMFPVRILFTSEEYGRYEIDFDKILNERIIQSLRDYETVIDAKTKELGITRDGDFEFIDVGTSEYSNHSDYLWWKLRTQVINNPFNGKKLVPVLIFDQFEEIFHASWKAQFFLWLERMLSDVCPDEIINELDGRMDNLPNRKLFKMLFSMRYEYVGELDYWCSQRNFIPLMMRNRYFLKPLKTEDAISIIKCNKGTDNDQFSARLSDKAQIIVSSIKENSKDNNTISDSDSDEVSAIALSLVCYVLYERMSNDPSFSLDDKGVLEKIINSSIYDYYDDQLNALQIPNHVRDVLEEVLSPNNDRPRIPITFPKLKECHIDRYIYGKKDNEGNEMPTLVSTHILKKETIDGVDYIEFIHDRLVLAIAKHKDELAQKASERKEHYKKVIKCLSPKQLQYIFNNLIYEDGSLRQKKVDEIKDVLGSFSEWSQGENRIFRFCSDDQVELLDDDMRSVVYEEKKSFEEKKRKEKIIIGTCAFIMAVLTLITAIWIIRSEIKEYRELNNERNRALQNQSRFIAEKIKAIAPEDSRLACLLAVEALPKSVNNPDRPYTKEAEWALREAASYHNMVLEGNQECVYSVCYSPNGKYVASGSDDGKVIVWNLLGSIVREFKLANAVLSVTFSPNGKNLVAASWNRIEVFDIERDTIAFASEIAAGGWINKVVYSPDGKTILAACNDNSIKILDSCGMEMRQLLGHSDKVSSCAFSPDGESIITASNDHTICIWDFNTGQLILSFDEHMDKVNDICFSPDGKQLVSGSSDKRALIWNVSEGKIMKELEFDNSVLGVSYSIDGKYIAFASWNQVEVLDTGTMEIVHTIIDGDENWIDDVAFSPDGSSLTYASESKVQLVGMDDAIGNHQFLKGRILFNHPGVVSATYNATGNGILTASKTNGVKLWDAITGDELLRYNTHYEGTTTAVFSPEESFIVFNDNNYAIICNVFDNTIDSLELKERIDYVSFHPLKKEIITLTKQDSTVRFLDINTSAIVDSIIGIPYEHILHQNNELIVYLFDTIEENKFSYIINILESYDLGPCDYPGPVGKIAYNRGYFANIIENQYVVNEVVQLQEVEYVQDAKVSIHWEKVIESLDDKFRINTIAFNPNGEYIIIAAKDHKVRIANGSPDARGFLCTLNHDSAVLSATFSPNGNSIMSVQEDGTVMIWDFPPLQDLIDQTRERFKDRPLTPEERRQYYLE